MPPTVQFSQRTAKRAVLFLWLPGLFPFTMGCSTFSCPSQMNTPQSGEGIKHRSLTETKKVLRTFEITHLWASLREVVILESFPERRKRGRINSTDPAPV